MTNLKKALLIIDMQKGSFTDKTPRFDSEGLIHRINSLSMRYRELRQLVIFIQHDGSGTGEFEKLAQDWEILDNLDVLTEDLLVDKTANDSFYKTDLLSILEAQGIQQLIITGCATDFCVSATIQSALTKDFDILVVEDGHTTADRPSLTAPQVITHYNWVWRNMTPTKGEISVTKTAQILKELEP